MLYIVPTPIGNLEDITLRAIRILKEVNTILAEDTRTSSKLLKHFEIDTKLQSYHMHNEHKAVSNIIDRLDSGESMALISDAGTPGISDPGYLLIREALKKNIQIECLPGATAFVPALVNSGLPCDSFVFYGFLPHKKGRETKFKECALETKTMVFYESPHRLLKTLLQLMQFLGEDRQLSVSRELSKLHEETVRGTANEVFDYFNSKTIKGEIVIVVAGNK